MTLSPWGDGVEESWCPSDKVNCPLVLALLWSSAAPVRNNITHIRWQHVLMYRGTVLPATVYPFCIVYFSFSSCNALITFSCRELIDIGLSLNLYIGLDWHYSTWVSRPSGLRGLLLGAPSVADSARRGNKSGEAELAIRSSCENNTTNPASVHLQHQRQIPCKQNSYNQRFTTTVSSTDCNWVLTPSKNP